MKLHRLVPLVLVHTLTLAGCAKDEAPALADGDEGRAASPVATATPEVDSVAIDEEVPGAQREPSRNDKRPSVRARPKRPKPRSGRGGALEEKDAPPPPVDGTGELSKEKRDKRLAKRKPLQPGDEALSIPLKGTSRYHDMFFRHYGVNPTIDTEEEPLSTFSVDVDTTSFSITRAFLSRGQMPTEASVRVEEFINSLDYGYAAPRDDVFAVSAEAAPSPNRRGYHVLHVGLKAKEIAKSQRKAANLVFVIDVSGSMDMDNRLGLVKRSLRLLVGELDEADTVGIVTYGSEAREVLQPTSAFNKHRILQVIDGLRTTGATNAEAGLRKGYAMAARQMRKGGISRVILCSDGVANTGLNTAGGLLDTVAHHAKKGITISTIGFGMGNYNDVMMEKLAQGGNGNYHYVDRLDQARKVFVENLTGTLQVVAKDVKIQVAFDPSVVQRYRLLGYENRKLASRDFNDDRVDAGEVGAGHAVTAVYELRLAKAAPTRSLGKVKVRFKAPTGGASRLVQRSLRAAIVKGRIDEVTAPTHLSFIAAAFAEKLRGSYWARNVSYEDILGRFNMLPTALQDRQEVRDLKALVERAQDLDTRSDKFAAQGPIAMMDFDRVPVLR